MRVIIFRPTVSVPEQHIRALQVPPAESKGTSLLLMSTGCTDSIPWLAWTRACGSCSSPGATSRAEIDTLICVDPAALPIPDGAVLSIPVP